MRDRAAQDLISEVVWWPVANAAVPPSLELVLIRRYEPPWNTQHNPSPRTESEAVPLDSTETAWIEESIDAFNAFVATQSKPTDYPRSRPGRA